MITIKALPPSRRPLLLPRASNQGFAQSIMQKYRHGEGRDPGYLALIHRDFSPSIGGQENHYYQTFIYVRMHGQMGSYLGLNRERLPNGQAGLPGSKEPVVMTQASGSGRKVRPATLIHELFRKWESSKITEKVYLPRLTVVSNGPDRYRWSSYVQSSVQRASSFEKWLLLWRLKEQIHPVDFAAPLLKAIVSDSKETVRESFWTPETPYVSPEFLVHTMRMGDPAGRRSLQHEFERIRLESAPRVDAISISRVRSTLSKAGRFEQFGVRNFLQSIGRGMEPKAGTWFFPVLLKRVEGRAARSFLDRLAWTEKAGNDGRDFTSPVVHKSESTRWSVACQQTELWGRWWENLSLYWQQSPAIWLTRTMSAHPRLRVLQPIVFPRSRQHSQAKSDWMIETQSDVSFIPLERKILQSIELSKLFSSLIPSMLHRADAGRANQQAVRERFKQLFQLAQQFSKAESDPVHAAVHGSRKSLMQIERWREQQSSTLFHWLRQPEQLATMLVSRIGQNPPGIPLHTLQLLPFEMMETGNQRNQWTYELRRQQLISQEARLNEIAREQSIRLRSSHEQTHVDNKSVLPALSRASYQQVDMLQQEWRTDSPLHVFHYMQGLLPFPLHITRITDSSRTLPLLSQSVVRKSMAAYRIRSFQSAIDPVFFEKRGWQPWIEEYLETHNEIKREPTGIASSARFVWNRFVPVFRVNRQLWQTLQNRIVSFTHDKTNGKSVMEWVHFQQMAASAPSRWLMQLLNVLTKENTSVSNHVQPAIHFLQNQHVFQMSNEMVRQLLSFQGERDKQTDVASSFSKNQEKFNLLGRKTTISIVHEREHRPIGHSIFLKNEQSTSRTFVHTHRHDREAILLRLNRFGFAKLRATEWIGLGGTDHQQLQSTSAKLAAMSEFAKIASTSEFAKIASTSEFAKVGSTSTSRKAPPSSEKQSNDQSRYRKGESNPLRESRRSHFLQQTASLWTNSVALCARSFLQVLEQIRKAIQTDFRTETYVQKHHPLSTVLNRHDVQMVVQKKWGPFHSLVHESGSRRAIEPLQRQDRVNSLEPFSRHHPNISGSFSREKSIDIVLDRLHSRQLSRRSRFQQSNHEHILTVNQKTQTVKRLTSDEAQEIEVRDARLTPLQRLGLFNLGSATMATEKVEQAEKNTSLTLVSKPMVAKTIQLPLLHALQQGQRTPREPEQHSLSENATHIHRRGLHTADSDASPAAVVQSPPSMEYLRKGIPPQESALQQTATLPLQRQVDLHVQERAGNQPSLSPQEVDRLMDKMMKELDKRLTQERQRRGL
ncbi:hypothetical protein ABE237_23720 [Brevibacillus formosus]|uniref:hypothetical protein n=1 Tax=Brevibacillus formosus TaxID=54913 RepID=UPI0018CEA71E|nr:hypothetical protein [Brevibacillus formosus]MBG9942458.1 hypothetical protein [Brevibacillus formosus]